MSRVEKCLVEHRVEYLEYRVEYSEVKVLLFINENSTFYLKNPEIA